MPRFGKPIEKGELALRPPNNLLEVLERRPTDTHLLRRTFRLFKKVPGGLRLQTFEQGSS